MSDKLRTELPREFGYVQARHPINGRWAKISRFTGQEVARQSTPFPDVQILDQHGLHISPAERAKIIDRIMREVVTETLGEVRDTANYAAEATRLVQSWWWRYT